MIEEHDSVALTRDLPEDGLVRGDIGAVVSVLAGGKAYTLEFVDFGGRTVAVRTLDASFVRPIAPNEMQSARPLAVA